jgi:MFS family permease
MPASILERAALSSAHQHRTVSQSGPRSYARLVRELRDFRLLWLGQLVSQLGDWFNSVAVYALLLDLTGSATAVAVMVVVQLLPSAIVGPYAGVVVDRLDRRHVMIAADIVRGCVVLGLLLVRNVESVWLAYAVIGLAVVATAFFEPARSAMLPSVVPATELVGANSLSSATWATMLAVGASLGGAITAWLGRDVAFVLNSASFFASAALIAAMRVDGRAAEARPGVGRGERTGFAEGIDLIRRTPRLAAYISIKGAWALAGGALLLLTVFGDRVFRIGDGAALGIGVLYGARGVGAGAGALLVGAFGSSRERLLRGVAPAYLTVGCCYASLAVAPNIWLASLAVAGSHAAGSVLWVASTVLLQTAVPDRYRGRIFAIDFALLTLVSAASSYATALAIDRLAVSPRAMAVCLGALFLVPALAWWRATPSISRDGTA